MGDSDLLLVQATVHLHGLPFGETALVDRDRPYIAQLLERRFLVAVEEEPHGALVQESPGVVAASPQADSGG